MDNRQDIEGVRFQWIRYSGGVDNLDASIPLALGFIDSDEWELVCSDRDRGAWKEAGEFSTMALVRALRMIEEWSESEPRGEWGRSRYEPNSRESSLRRKVQRKLERMSEDPPLVIPLTPGQWRVESEEYKGYCRMRFEMSKRMDDSWSFQKESSSWSDFESKRTKIQTSPPIPPIFHMTMNQDWSTGEPEGGHAKTSKRHRAIDELERLQKRILVTQENRLHRSKNLITQLSIDEFDYSRKRVRENHNSNNYRWEKKLDRRFKRLTVGKVKDSEERVWPLKSIPEPDRDEEGIFLISSKKKKMKWKIHLRILEIMMERHKPRIHSRYRVPEKKWITRKSLSNSLKKVGEEITEGRISQVLGDLVGLGAIHKKSDKDDGRIKLYRVKDDFSRNSKEKIREDVPSPSELEKLRNILVHNTNEDEETLHLITKMIDEIIAAA